MSKVRLEDEKKLTVALGTTYELRTAVEPDNATNTKLKWASSDETVCTIDENGRIMTKTPGDSVISCKTTDGTDITTSILVHIPIFSTLESSYSVTEKKGLVIPVELNGFDWEQIVLTEGKGDCFLCYFDDKGIHVFPIKPGTDTVYLSGINSKEDKAAYNVTIEDTAVYDTNNGDTEPLHAFITINETSVYPGDKLTARYYISGGVQPYSVCEAEFYSSSWNASTSTGPLKLKKVPTGSISGKLDNWRYNEYYYATLRISDATGNTYSVDSNPVKIKRLSVLLDSDLYAVRKGKNFGLNYRIEGGSGKYHIKVTGQIEDTNTHVDLGRIQLENGETDSEGFIEYMPNKGTDLILSFEIYDMNNKRLYGYVGTPHILLTDDWDMKVQYDKDKLVVGEPLTAYLIFDGASIDKIDSSQIAFSFSEDNNAFKDVKAEWVNDYVMESAGKWKKMILSTAKKGYMKFTVSLKGQIYAPINARIYRIKEQ